MRQVSEGAPLLERPEHSHSVDVVDDAAMEVTRELQVRMLWTCRAWWSSATYASSCFPQVLSQLLQQRQFLSALQVRNMAKSQNSAVPGRRLDGFFVVLCLVFLVGWCGVDRAWQMIVCWPNEVSSSIIRLLCGSGFGFAPYGEWLTLNMSLG